MLRLGFQVTGFVVNQDLSIRSLPIDHQIVDETPNLRRNRLYSRDIHGCLFHVTENRTRTDPGCAH